MQHYKKSAEAIAKLTPEQILLLGPPVQPGTASYRAFSGRRDISAPRLRRRVHYIGRDHRQGADPWPTISVTKPRSRG